jgi:autotransporter-associated beta strand protein
LWLNPATGQSDESGAGVTPLTLTTGSDASGAFTNLLLYGTVADTSGPLYIDEIRVSDSWAEATPDSGPPPRDLTWDADNGTTGAQDGGGTWDNENNNNWWIGSANTVWSNALSDRATIGVGDGTAGTIIVSGTITNGGLAFAMPGSGHYTLSGGTLYLTGGVTNHADATINTAISGAGLAKYGNGTLTLGGANTYAGVTVVGAGTLKLGAAEVIPDGFGKGGVMVIGTLDLNGNSEGINELSGDGMVTNSGGAATLPA